MSVKPESTDCNISLLYASMLPESQKQFFNRNDLLYTVRHDKIIIYKGIYSSQNAKKRDRITDANLKKRKYNGELSSSSVKHVGKQVTLWADSVENYNKHYHKPLSQRRRQLTFFTLTLPSPQRHTDQEIKRKVFVPFIDSMKYHFDTNHYFWRAEAQQNNNIHFHVIFDKYMPVKEVRDLWHTCLERLEYITEFEKKHDHRNPPTTHAKMISESEKSIKYVLKYATKSSENRLITGKIWGMSDSIRNLRVPTFTDPKKIIDQLFKDIENKASTWYYGEHYASFTYKNPIFTLTNSALKMSNYTDHLYKIYSYLYFTDCPFDSDLGMLIYEGLDLDEIKSITKYVDRDEKDQTVGQFIETNDNPQ